jgi:hypothetical protein
MESTMDARSQLFQRVERRRRKGGAAMVEGAFVGSIWVMLFNLCVFICGTYMAKIESSQVSRYQAFYYSAHNCTGDVPAYAKQLYPSGGASNSKSEDSGASQGGMTDGNDLPATTNQGYGDDKKPETSFFVTHSKATAKFNFPDSVNVLDGDPNKVRWTTALMNRPVFSESHVMCNEAAHGYNIVDVLKTQMNQIGGLGP